MPPISAPANHQAQARAERRPHPAGARRGAGSRASAPLQPRSLNAPTRGLRTSRRFPPAPAPGTSPAHGGQLPAPRAEGRRASPGHSRGAVRNRDRCPLLLPPAGPPRPLLHLRAPAVHPQAGAQPGKRASSSPPPLPPNRARSSSAPLRRPRLQRPEASTRSAAPGCDGRRQPGPSSRRRSSSGGGSAPCRPAAARASSAAAPPARRAHRRPPPGVGFRRAGKIPSAEIPSRSGRARSLLCPGALEQCVEWGC